MAVSGVFQRSLGVSWAQPDKWCGHLPGPWWRDPARVDVVLMRDDVPLSYCTTTCRTCGRALYGAFTQFGTLIDNYGTDKEKVK